jgi:hypothetical protein
MSAEFGVCFDQKSLLRVLGASALKSPNPSFRILAFNGWNDWNGWNVWNLRNAVISRA